MQEFNPDSETISAYLERFNLFVTVNGIEEGKQVSSPHKAALWTLDWTMDLRTGLD